jgi:DNA polymerase-3 subunit delta'
MFESYPWHDDVLLAITERLQQGVLPAAIGLSCAEGWGGRALLAAATLLLLELPEDKDPEELAHPDFRWVAPEGAAIKIDQIRALNAFAVQTSQIAPRKVVAVLDAHLMNVNAANTLLKTLEEPPANTHILLCTPYWNRLLPTIRSRCQSFQVQAAPGQADTWLQQQAVPFSPQRFAQAGYAPLTMRDQFAELDVDEWLNKVATAAQFSALVDDALEIGAPLLLAAWYRVLVQQQNARPSRVLLAFAEELIDTRRMIETSNSTNIRLALERLFHLWQQVSKRVQRQVS